jgi:hypothetical protein
MMTYSARLEQAVDYLVVWLKIKAPKDTGNLAINAIKKVWNPEVGTWDIVIGGELAPYAVYTNGVWINRPGVNPNEGWIQNACIEAKPVLSGILSGTMSEEEANKMLVNNNTVLRMQFSRLAEAI